MLDIFLEIFVCLLITYIFIKREKPNLKFYLLGVFVFFISLILQIPVKYLELEIMKYFSTQAISIIAVSIIGIFISELLKYYSLKRYLKKTRSYKNAIIFGLGWVTFESVTFFSLIFYQTLFSLFNMTISPSIISSGIIPFWNFISIFIVNMGITVLVIFSVIKRDLFYLFFAILFASLVYLTLFVVHDKIFFEIIFVMYSLFLIFKYKKIK